VLVILKVEGIEPDVLRKLLEPVALEIQDIHIC
jgi:hypothetical protein